MISDITLLPLAVFINGRQQNLNNKLLFKRKRGAALWCSGLRIQHCHCSGVGHCHGMGLIPGLGTSTCYRCGKKKLKKRRIRIAVFDQPKHWGIKCLFLRAFKIIFRFIIIIFLSFVVFFFCCLLLLLFLGPLPRHMEIPTPGVESEL